MAGKGLSLKMLLQLESKQFKAGIKSIQNQLKGFGNFVKSAFALSSITMFGRELVNIGKEFENAMARVKAVSNANSQQFKLMQAEAQKMGATTIYTATEAANALENLTRNGKSATEATKMLSSVLKLAQANSVGLAEAADILTNTMNMFGLSADNASRINDVLSSTAANTATNLTDLYGALINAAPAAKVLGFSLEETAAAIGALAQKGIKGEAAGTQLRMSLTKLADPKITKKLREYGVAIDENTMKNEGFLKTVKKLSDAQLTLADLVAIFSQKGAVNIQQLINGYSEFERAVGITTSSLGTTDRMFTQSVGNMEGELKKLKSQYQDFLITLSQKTDGVLLNLVKLLQNIIGNFKTVGGTIMNVASVAVPLLTTKVIKLMGDFRKFFVLLKTEGAAATAMMGGWITIVATLVTWIGTALVGAWNRAHAAIREVRKEMEETAVNARKTQAALDSLTSTLGKDTDETSLAGIVNKLIQLFPDFADTIRNAAKVAAETGDWEKLKQVLQDIADLQALMDTRSTQEKLADIAASKLASTVYDYSQQSDKQINKAATQELKDLGNLSKSIREYLEDIGFSEDNIKDFFKEIVSIVMKNYRDQNKKVDDVSKLLKSYGIGIGNDRAAVTALIKAITVTSISNKKTEAAFMGGMTALQNAAKADSTYQQKQIEIAKKAFEDQEILLKKKLNDQQITQDEFYERMGDEVEKYGQVLAQNNPTKGQKLEYQDLQEKYPKIVKTKTPLTVTGGDGQVAKGSPMEQVKQSIAKYKEGINALDNRLAEGTITADDYESQIKKLTDTTWESITAVDNFRDVLEELKETALGDKLKDAYKDNRNIEEAARQSQEFDKNVGKWMKFFKLLGDTQIPKKGERDTTFDYAKTTKEIREEELKIKLDDVDALQKQLDTLLAGLSSEEFAGFTDEAIYEIEALKDAIAKAKTEANNFKHAMNLAEAEEQLSELQDQLKNQVYSSFSELANAADRLYRSVQSIAEAFGAEIEWEGFEKGMAVVNGFIQILDTLGTVMKAVQLIDDIVSKKKLANAAKQEAAALIVAGAETTKATAEAGAAVAGGANSVASIPYVGAFLAVAMAAAIAAAIAAGMGKFATGGIVGGNKTTGDQNLARVNSGEMILNKAQQGNLFNAIQNGTLGSGGSVKFKISGSDLIGAIENHNKIRRG